MLFHQNEAEAVFLRDKSTFKKLSLLSVDMKAEEQI
jgi:hypothetical protein